MSCSRSSPERGESDGEVAQTGWNGEDRRQLAERHQYDEPESENAIGLHGYQEWLEIPQRERPTDWLDQPDSAQAEGDRDRDREADCRHAADRGLKGAGGLERGYRHEPDRHERGDTQRQRKFGASPGPGSH